MAKRAARPNEEQTTNAEPTPPPAPAAEPHHPPGVALEFTKRGPGRQPGKLEQTADLTQAAKFVAADMAKVVAGSPRDRKTVEELAGRFRAERAKATKEAKEAVEK